MRKRMARRASEPRQVAFHGVVVRQEASERFAALLRSSEAAYQRRGVKDGGF